MDISLGGMARKLVAAQDEIERLRHDRLDCQVVMDSQQIEIERLLVALNMATYSLCTDDYETQQAVAENIKSSHQQNGGQK
jgi:hypothetical protein